MSGYLYTVKATPSVEGEEYELVVRYLKWQGLLQWVETVPLADVLRATHGCLNPHNAFFVTSPNGSILLGFHAVVTDVAARGLIRC